MVLPAVLSKALLKTVDQRHKNFHQPSGDSTSWCGLIKPLSLLTLQGYQAHEAGPVYPGPGWRNSLWPSVVTFTHHSVRSQFCYQRNYNGVKQHYIGEAQTYDGPLQA